MARISTSVSYERHTKETSMQIAEGSVFIELDNGHTVRLTIDSDGLLILPNRSQDEITFISVNGMSGMKWSVGSKSK